LDNITSGTQLLYEFVVYKHKSCSADLKNAVGKLKDCFLELNYNKPYESRSRSHDRNTRHKDAEVNIPVEMLKGESKAKESEQKETKTVETKDKVPKEVQILDCAKEANTEETKVPESERETKTVETKDKIPKEVQKQDFVDNNVNVSASKVPIHESKAKEANTEETKVPPNVEGQKKNTERAKVQGPLSFFKENHKEQIKNCRVSILDGKWTGHSATFNAWSGNIAYLDIDDVGKTGLTISRKIEVCSNDLMI